MLNIEDWSEHHQWVGLALALASFLTVIPQVRAFIGALPKGLRLAVDAYRRSLLGELEYSIQRPTRVIERVVLFAAYEAILSTVHYVFLQRAYHVPRMGELNSSTISPSEVFCILLGVKNLIVTVGAAATSTVFVLWAYRHPAKRILKLRKQVEDEFGFPR